MITTAETVSQAITWTTTKNAYLDEGLCHACAAQAAWGHQVGFSKLEHAPCALCAPIVATFPLPAAGGVWRKFESDDSHAPASAGARTGELANV